MVYMDYEFYIGSYYGNLSADDFSRLSVRASSFLDYYTCGRAERNAKLPAVKMACCALIDKLHAIEAAQALAEKCISAGLAADGKELQSESVGGYSRAFRGSGDSATAALKAADMARESLASVAREYLAGTGLLYRGRCF